MGEWIGAQTLEFETADGEKYVARTIFADAVAYESTARKHGWGSIRESGLQSVAFTGWHALRRAGDLPGTVKYEEFRDQIVAFRDAGEPPPDPTLPGQPDG